MLQLNTVYMYVTVEHEPHQGSRAGDFAEGCREEPLPHTPLHRGMLNHPLIS